MRVLVAIKSGLSALVFSALLVTASARAEDSDQTRAYLALRLGEKVAGVSDASDLGGAAVGVNWNRVLSLEVALDSFELKAEGISEMSVLGLIPQVRLRWPVFSDRLSPYLLAGVGTVVSQANDPRVPVEWGGGTTRAHPAGTVGGGVDYFIRDNLAIMLEGKYLMSGDVSYRSADADGSFGLSQGIFTGGLRLFYPELHAERGEQVADTGTVGFYVHPRIGAAILIHGTPFHGVEASAEQPIVADEVTPVFGVSLGAEVRRFAAVEVSFENYELNLTVPGTGRVGEYAVFPITVQSRFRRSMLADRIEPYALFGVGGEMAQLNDRTTAGRKIDVSGSDVAVVGDVGIGVDYRLMSNVTLGGQAKYIISRGHKFRVNGVEKQGNLDSLLFSVGVTVVLFSA